jgi:hypothetical protein
MYYNVKNFGAIGDGINDDWPAFHKALNAMLAPPSLLEVHGGGVLLVPAGNYFLSKTLRITHEAQIIGISGYPGNGAFVRFKIAGGAPALVDPAGGWPGGVSRLMFPRGVTGIFVAQGGTPPVGYFGHAPYEKGQGSILRNLVLVSADGTNPTKPREFGHGVSVKSRIVIDNCFIFNFAGNGIHFVAPSNPQNPGDTTFGEWRDLKHPELGDLYLDNTYKEIDAGGNPYLFRANATTIDSRVVGTMCRGNLLNGVYVFGSNAGTMLFESVHCIANRSHGFFDSPTSSSNLYLNCHAQDNVRGDYYSLSTVEEIDERGNAAPPQGGPGSTYINCYQEGGTNTRIYGPSIILGGSIADDGIIHSDSDPDLDAYPGFIFSPPWLTRFASNARASAGFPYGISALGGGGDLETNKIQIEIGGSVPNVAISLQHFYSGPRYDLTYDTPTAPGWWSLVFDSAGAQPSPLRFSTEKADVKERQIWFENGFYAGQGVDERVKICVASSPGDAQMPEEGWKKGDRILNNDPIPGDAVKGFAGWICTSVMPVTWGGFGEIKALP